ncbi:HNH endonuclease signature motif containing protein [Brevibacterium gallinarum]|uniref:HNH endonuclease n=1 Tax=Brevibacterium gallinarum TaxID=2762220 RepID=A0ABR8WSA6_9MICO|nr:HNH endonuclease signature motif containing protein [Brevibacterium gallinarum]MBD8019768.1 HNH endonuclease [Brevibacterium gallinarum]
MVRSEGRFATGTQMTLLKARDRGCSFPDCDIPVGWCEAHHIRAHRHGWPTEISNLTFLCRFHHGWHERHGWRAALLNGLPAWIPPYTVDRERRPIYHSRYIAELTRPEALLSCELLADASFADSLPPDDADGASDRSAPGPSNTDDARISGDAEVDDGAGFSDDGWFESASLLPEDALFPESRCDDPP